MEKAVSAVEENRNRENIMKVWKDYTTEYAIVIKEKAIKFLLEETVSRCCT